MKFFNWKVDVELLTHSKNIHLYFSFKVWFTSRNFSITTTLSCTHINPLLLIKTNLHSLRNISELTMGLLSPMTTGPLPFVVKTKPKSLKKKRVRLEVRNGSGWTKMIKRGDRRVRFEDLLRKEDKKVCRQSEVEKVWERCRSRHQVWRVRV